MGVIGIRMLTIASLPLPCILGLKGRCLRQVGAPVAEQHGWRAGRGHIVLAHAVQVGVRGRCWRQVAHRVQGEFPSVQTLATLSPLPGFRSWLRRQLQSKPDAVHVPFPCQPVRLCIRFRLPHEQCAQHYAQQLDTGMSACTRVAGSLPLSTRNSELDYNALGRPDLNPDPSACGACRAPLKQRRC